MTLVNFLTVFVAVTAIFPAALFVSNWFAYRAPPIVPPPADDSADVEKVRNVPSVSLLIPARNEAAFIGVAVDHALASRGVNLEVVVLDDESTDGTSAIVRKRISTDPRVRLIQAAPLPPGWCGKQYACHLLAAEARHPVLAFVDADVRLEPDALSRATAFLQDCRAGLVSGFPHQETGTLLEKLLIPLIHFVLLGFLPLHRSRRSLLPGLAAGCGQLLLARRDDYVRAGGHAAIRSSLHDGITLPRAFRRQGIRTDLFDAESMACCRMYRSSGDVWRGLAKNATEGMAGPVAIIPWTLLLLGGQVLPLIVLVFLCAGSKQLNKPQLELALFCAAAIAISYLMRVALAVRFAQNWLGVLLHPIAVFLLVTLQWYALAMKVLGRPATWKGRSYQSSEGVGPTPAAAMR